MSQHHDPHEQTKRLDAESTPNVAGEESSEMMASQHNLPYRPQYMTVGSGSESSNAAALIAELEHDSGYGSMMGDGQGTSGDMRAWHDELLQDRPTPAHTPVLPGETNSAAESERKILASHVHQLYYNQNRVA